MSEANIIIRPGTVKEYSQAREVISETFAFHQQAAPEFFRTTDSPPPTPVVIEDFLRDGQGAWFLAEAGGRVVGFATVRLRPAADEPFLVPAVRAHVDSLGILPAWVTGPHAPHLLAPNWVEMGREQFPIVIKQGTLQQVLTVRMLTVKLFESSDDSGRK